MTDQENEIRAKIVITTQRPGSVVDEELSLVIPSQTPVAKGTEGKVIAEYTLGEFPQAYNRVRGQVLGAPRGRK